MSKFKGLFSQNGVLSKLLILIGFSCSFTVFGMIIWIAITHGNATDVASLKLLQLLQSIGMFVLPPFALAYFCSGNTSQFLHFDKNINWVDTALVVLFMIAIIPFVNLLGDLNQKLVLPKVFAGLETMMKASEEQAAQLTGKLLNVHTIQALFFNIFLIAMIPALGEELFFRGALQGIFQEKINVKAAIWIAAIIFSAIHLQFYGCVPRMLMGAFFGYLLVWSENIWLPIVAHFTNNVLAVVFYYFKNNGYKLPDIDTIGTGNTLWLGCASGVLVILGVSFLMQHFQNSNSKIENF
jgi:uncharacterized protein